MEAKITLCPQCLALLREAASRGGKAGSSADKQKAGRVAGKLRQKSAMRLRYGGKTKLVSQWAEELHISKRKLWRRIRQGLPVKAVLSTHSEKYETPATI